MPINESENKNITTNTNSSTDNIGSIKVNEMTSTITGSLNNIANNPIENYDLDEPGLGTEGILNKDSLDFSRIAVTAGNVKEGNFVNVKNPEYWGDNADLTYKIREDGTVAISEDGVILGFTDLQGIRIKEADASKEEQIVREETSKTSSEVETEIQESEENKDVLPTEQKEEIKEEPVEVKEEQEEIKSEEKKPEETKTEVLEEVAEEQAPVAPQEAPPIEPLEQQVEAPQPSNETSASTIAVPDNVRQTGIIKNYTNYSYFYGKWNKGTGQRAVADLWDANGRQNKNGIATLNGRYLVAVSPIFGTNGDIIDVVLDDGTTIPCIIGDAKGSDATSQYGHMFGSSVDVIEWESFGSKEDIVIDQWEGKNVVQIVNKGSILTN